MSSFTNMGIDCTQMTREVQKVHFHRRMEQSSVPESEIISRLISGGLRVETKTRPLFHKAEEPVRNSRRASGPFFRANVGVKGAFGRSPIEELLQASPAAQSAEATAHSAARLTPITGKDESTGWGLPFWETQPRTRWQNIALSQDTHSVRRTDENLDLAIGVG